MEVQAIDPRIAALESLLPTSGGLSSKELPPPLLPASDPASALPGSDVPAPIPAPDSVQLSRPAQAAASVPIANDVNAVPVTQVATRIAPTGTPHLSGPALVPLTAIPPSNAPATTQVALPDSVGLSLPAQAAASVPIARDVNAVPATQLATSVATPGIARSSGPGPVPLTALPPTQIALPDSVGLSLPAQAAASVPIARDANAAPLAHIAPQLATPVATHVAAQIPTPGVLPTGTPTALPPPALPHADEVIAALATQIAEPDMARFSAILQPHRSPELAAQVTTLTAETTLALAHGDHPRALTNLNQLAAVDPHALAALAPESALQPIRPEVDHLLNRMTTVAKMDAEGWLAQAHDVVETPGHPPLTNWQTKPEMLLTVAHRLFDAGGFTNYTRSTELAQTILNESPINQSPIAYSPFLEQYALSVAPKPLVFDLSRSVTDELLPKKPLVATVQKTAAALRAAAAPRLQTLWRRAPLLVLLLSWLGLGVVLGPAALLLRAVSPDSMPASLIDFGFDVWATGFLALVCFGFYARTRNTRRQPL